jgi:acyl-CoA dehydrogenase
MPLFEESKEHSDFRKVVRKFVAKEITPNREEWDKAGIVPRELFLKMGKQGFLCPWLPEEYGGMDVDARYSLVIVNEELAWGDGFSVGAPLHSDVAAPYLFSYGTEELKKRVLPKAASGEAILAIGLTEPDAGSDLASIRTKAVKDGDHYIINGQKTFITNGINSDVIITACKIESPTGQKGISMIVVDGDTPGLTRRKLHKLGQDSQDTAELAYVDCRVPASNLLGEEGKGFKYMMEKLARERLEVCVKCQAMAELAFKEGLEYAKVREAFKKPIGDFQHNSFKIAEMATDVTIGRNFLETLVAEYMRGENIDPTRISIAKAYLGEMVNRVAYHSLQLHGGYGYMEEYKISRIYRDVRALSILAGTTEIMKLIIARNLGLNPQ